jgi:hypothetical protein
MIFFTAALVSSILLMALLGFGWARFLQLSVNGFSTISITYLAPLLWLLVVSVTWVWVYTLNGSITTVNLVTLLVSLSGYGLMLKRTHFVRPRFGFRFLKSWWPLAVVLVAALPSFNSPKSWNYPVRIGPDAVAYATGARVMQETSGYDRLRERIEKESDKDLSELLDTKNPVVYSMASYSDQIATEIILGALRYASVGSIAIVTQITGDQSAFIVMNVFAGIAMFLSVGICCDVLRRRNRKSCTPYVMSSSLAISPALLVAWHEGFYAHLLVLPFVVLGVGRLLELLDSDSHEHKRADIPILISIIGIVAIYPDYVLFLVPVIGVLLFLLLIVESTRRKGWSVLQTLARSSTMAAILLAPFVTPLFHWVLARLSQTKINGYWQPTWISPIEILGLVNIYSGNNIFRAVGIGNTSASFVLQIFLWAISFLLILAVTVSLRPLPGIQSLNIALLCTVFLIFLQNNIRDLNNYQFFKAMSYALPVLVYLVGISWMTRINLVLFAKFLGTVVVLLMITATYNYQRHFSYTSLTHTYDQMISSDAAQPKIRRELEKYNLLARGDHIVMGSLVSSSNVFWMHRGIQGYETNFNDRRMNPLGWIIFNDDRELFDCVSDHLGEPAVKAEDNSFHVYEVLANSDATVVNAAEAVKAMTSFFGNNDLGTVESGWQPSTCMQKDIK